MKCSVCEGTSFTEDCGLRTCDDCGTEDRNFVTLENQEFLNSLDASQLIRLKKEKIEVDIIEEPTLGRIETYNIILHSWTKSLLSLGASHRFEKIIFELWIWYLQRTGIAFSQEEDSQETDSIKLKMDTLQNKKYCFFPSTANVQENHVPKAVTVKVFETMKKDLLPDNISFAKLFGIFYLALLLAEEPILLMDLIRWCREGHIPYFSAHNLLPPGFKSEVIKGPYVIDFDTIKDHSVNMAMFLNILYLPMPDYRNIIDRVVKILRLPVCVGDMALQLMKKLFAVTNKSKMFVFGIEMYAIASVIRTLIDYWGLDDCDEYYLSTATRKINEEIGEKSSIAPLFCWEEWQKHINKLIWFCGEVDYITNMHSRKSEFCNFGEAGSFSRFAWTEGIWRLGFFNPSKTLGISAKQCQSYAEKLLDAQNTSLEAQINQSFVYKPTRLPIYGTVEQFVNHSRKEDEHGLVKIGRELLDINFSDHFYDFPTIDVLQKELKKCGSSFKLVTSIPKKPLGEENKFLVYMPQPFKRKSPNVNFKLFKGKLKSYPSRSLEWLLAICFIFFEVNGYELSLCVKLYNDIHTNI
ncbi:TATA box-binding protein-associated factor RNA polymerase I subunit B [Palaemon carinicauda]|uniref:TATA box-binding protein-associated factor RNA polymerase I subunit B n=1 Tax=Palaemon carinicauda TaxID=392227 RepID=UPI0035B637FC